jgi:Sec-independent protein translocase protein TatA
MRGLGKGVKEFKDEVAGNGTKPEDADHKPQADKKDEQ